MSLFMVSMLLSIETKAPCGLCVPVQNIKKLMDAISILMNDLNRAAIMGKRGIERILNNYTLDRVIIQYKYVWENVDCIKCLDRSIS